MCSMWMYPKILSWIWFGYEKIRFICYSRCSGLAGGCISKGADESMSYHPDFIASQSPSYPASSKASRWVYLHLPMWQSLTVGGLFSKPNAMATNIQLNWKLVILVDNCTAAQCNFIILGYYNWLQNTTYCTTLAMSLAFLRSIRARRKYTHGDTHTKYSGLSIK